jgi:hypothetical protein
VGDLPSPLFLKVADIDGDETVCFDTDLEVLILGSLRFATDEHWTVGGEITRHRMTNGRDSGN